MNATKPANLSTAQTIERNHPRVKDLTFLLGPPTAPDAVEEIERTARKVGVTPEEFWIKVVEKLVADLIEAGADGHSTLDEMVSWALGEPVTVWEVHGALHIQCGRQLPGLTLHPPEILDANGRPADHDFSDNQIRRRIGSALMQYTNADWVSCTAVYAADELGFPRICGPEKEA